MTAKAAGGAIRVLVADASPQACQFLAGILNGAPGIVVTGMAGEGDEVVRQAMRLRPDVIVMSTRLPGLDGFSVSRRIMENCPTRILLTAAGPADLAALNFQAVEAGALMVLDKPACSEPMESDPAAVELVRAVRLMSEVQVVKRWPRGARAVPAPAAAPAARATPRIVAIGASTGGPSALQSLLSGLPRNFPVPLVIVQHISDSFIEGLAKWLRDTTHFPVRVAAAGEIAQPGTAYLSPDNFHMQVRADATIELVDGPKEHATKPSVSVLFRSVTSAFGPAAIGVLLTGMGRDGAQELKTMREKGAVTFAQDRETCAVFGMPGTAVALGAATHVLPPERIATMLADMVGCKENKPDRRQAE